MHVHPTLKAQANEVEMSIYVICELTVRSMQPSYKCPAGLNCNLDLDRLLRTSQHEDIKGRIDRGGVYTESAAGGS